MNKSIKVSKISLESLDQLRQAGYIVEIQQITVIPSNPRLDYVDAAAIRVLTKNFKRGIDKPEIKAKVTKKSADSSDNLKSLKRRLAYEQN